MRTSSTSKFRPLLAPCMLAALALTSSLALANDDEKAPGKAASPAGSFALIDGEEAPIPDIRMGDHAVIARIIDEGKNRNQVMKHLEHLTKNIGHRLTGSTSLYKANEWCRDLYTQWGIKSELWQWGTVGTGFDRGPSKGAVYRIETRRSRPARRGAGAAGANAQPPADQPAPEEPAPRTEYVKARDMELTTLAWTSGTDGPVRGTVVWAPYTEEAYNDVKDNLKGAWVLLKPPSERDMRGVRGRMSTWYTQFRDARKKIDDGEDASKIDLPARVITDGVAGFIIASNDDRVWTGSVGGWREMTPETLDPEVLVSVRLSDYDYINSRLCDGDPIAIEFDLQHTFVPGPVPVYNTIAEIPGSTWPEQCVIISGHLDSWDGPGSEGCTDNGTGTSVTLEAARILASVLKNAPPEARPKRTIKFIHWTGEEQGLLGSDAWVKAQKDNWPNISACFVDDGGTNYEGGLPALAEQVPMLAAATAPINNVFYSDTDGKYLNVDIKTVKGTPGRRPGGGSSDHASFNRVGVPGFFWEEVGRADYGYGWHTQNDKLSLAIPEYLMQSATNAALTAYQLACADDLLPRAKPPEEKKPDEAKPDEGSQARGGEPAPEAQATR